jgi:SAM-dependent methyltransferase
VLSVTDRIVPLRDLLRRVRLDFDKGLMPLRGCGTLNAGRARGPDSEEEVARMDDDAARGRPMFGAHSNYFFDRNAGERRRLENQFHLFGEDFDRWFDEALRVGGLPTDPGRAEWTMVDLGCGEGQFTSRAAGRYPKTTVVGMDVDRDAVDTASRNAAANARFLVHDAREPLPPVLDGGAAFDVAVMWMVLLYLPDKRGALANLAGAVAPGGVVLLCNQRDEGVRFSHPDATELIAATFQMARRFDILVSEASLESGLTETGFTDAVTVRLEYPLGGATSSGQRWWAHLLTTLAGSRRAVVEVGGLMDGAEFDRKVEALAADPMLRHTGRWDFLVTLARRKGG